MTPPLFCLVEACPIGGDDYEIFGAYCKREDAEAHKSKLEASTGVILDRSACIIEGVSMDAIKRTIAADRLGELAKSIDRLLEAAQSTAP